MAFDAQAPFFDALYRSNTIIQFKRKRVRDHIRQFLKPGSNILELNAGTGEDATCFAREGHRVHATDISGKMQQELLRKVHESHLQDAITSELCSFTELENLGAQGPYDAIFSNFAGLNCTNHLSKVLDSFSPLLKPGGIVTLVLLPKFCLWEFMLLFKWKFKTAFRRFQGKKGTTAKIDNNRFHCWYYNPSYIRNYLQNSFDVIGLEGLCTLVPPSYMEGFAEKHPRLYNYLVRKENHLKSRWPWRSIGDYYIISLIKKA